MFAGREISFRSAKDTLAYRRAEWRATSSESMARREENRARDYPQVGGTRKSNPPSPSFWSDAINYRFSYLGAMTI